MKVALWPLVAFSALAAAVQAADRPVRLRSLPAAVQKAIHEQAGQARIGRIEKIETDGEVSYEVEIGRGGGNRSFTVADDGALLDIEITFAELPAAAQKTAKSEIGNGKIEIARKVFGDEITYEVEFTRSGQERALSVDGKGKLLTLEIALAEAPPAVRKTIESLSSGGKLGEIEKSFENGGVTYDFDVTKNGVSRDYSVSEDGHIVSEEVLLPETPAAVQKSFQAKLGGAKLISIEKAHDKDQRVIYQVEAKKAGRDFDFSVTENGELLGMK
jgi:uncharacterized membrane protein YkoI